MKKLLPLIGLALLFTGNTFAQSYYFVKKKVGTTSEYNMNQTGFTALMTAPANDKLSTMQTLPFAWSFYGQPVTKFIASENGYITFDTTATVSVGANTTLPNAAGPNNAIYAFWDDLKLEQVQSFPSAVRTWTYGTAPNRVFVIQWLLTSVQGQAANANVTYFAIRLYEAGDFDIVHNYGFGTFAATVGVENEDGTQATMLPGSPNKNFGGNNGSYSAAKSDVYAFTFGTLPYALEASVVSHNVKSQVATTDNTIISGVIANNGGEDITSLTLNYSVNGGTPVTDNKTGLNITGKNEGTYNFSHAVPFKGATPGQTYTIKVWASNLNGNADENPANDTLTFSVFVNNGTSAPKNVLIEEGSGAWCQHCPDGHIRLKEILAGSPNVIGVVHHNGDLMTNPQSDVINSTYQTGFPYGVVDRTLFSDQTTVGLNRGLWATKAFERLNANTPVKVTISDKSYNPDTRQIKFTVKAEFVDFAQGDMRIGAMIVEDNVRGLGTGYNQILATVYSNDPNHPFYGYPTSLVGYPHNHAVINIPSGAFGNSGIISNTVTPGQSFTKEYIYTLPAATTVEIPETSKFDPKGTVTGRNKPYDIQLVGFVAYYNTDVKNRQVLNSVETSLGVTNGIAEEVKAEAGNVSLYPNPTNGISSVVFELPKASNASVEIYNALGQKIQTVKEGNFVAGQHTVFFDASQFENGIYFLNVTTNEGRTAKRFVVVK